jgi:hypothetical protein
MVFEPERVIVNHTVEGSMKHLKSLLVLVGAASSVTVGLATLVVGCGDDSVVPPGDSGPDSTSDAQAEVGPDVGADVAADVAPDNTIGDASDGGTDSSDAADAPVDAFDAAVIGQFPFTVTQAFCQRLQTCCAPNDAGFDNNFCVSSTLGQGGVNGDGLGNYQSQIPVNGGSITWNPAKAQACLQDIANIPCGTVTSANYLQIRNDCYGALVGTIAVNGSGCVNHLDCAPQGYCNIIGDAGTGTCAALVSAAGACTFNEQCTYRGTGQPAMFCNTGGSNTCVPQGDVDAACGTTNEYNQECTTELCVAPGVCGTQTIFSDPGVPNGICASLAAQDAGGGG